LNRLLPNRGVTFDDRPALALSACWGRRASTLSGSGISSADGSQPSTWQITEPTSELGRYLPGLASSLARRAGELLFPLALQPPAWGALPTVREATDPEAFGGAYYGPVGFRELRGDPVLVRPARHALDEGDQERLWAVSEELTGVRNPA
jgi:hypothetical protein